MPIFIVARALFLMFLFPNRINIERELPTFYIFIPHFQVQNASAALYLLLITRLLQQLTLQKQNPEKLIYKSRRIMNNHAQIFITNLSDQTLLPFVNKKSSKTWI